MIQIDGMKMTVDLTEVAKAEASKGKDTFRMIQETAEKMIVENANTVMDLTERVELEFVGKGELLTTDTAPDDMTMRELKKHNDRFANMGLLINEIRQYAQVYYFSNEVIEKVAVNEYPNLTADDAAFVSAKAYDVFSRDSDYVQNIDDLFDLASEMKHRGVDSVK